MYVWRGEPIPKIIYYRVIRICHVNVLEKNTARVTSTYVDTLVIRNYECTRIWCCFVPNSFLKLYTASKGKSFLHKLQKYLNEINEIIKRKKLFMSIVNSNIFKQLFDKNFILNFVIITLNYIHIYERNKNIHTLFYFTYTVYNIMLRTKFKIYIKLNIQ